MQQDKARLYQVTLSFGYIMNILKQQTPIYFRNRMVKRLELRWAGWEQPLLILSLALHPKYRLEMFSSTIKNLTYSHIGRWLTYYYKSWFKKDSTTILQELEKFKKQKYPFCNETFKQFNDIVEWWKSVSDVAPELGIFASHLFGICINTASCERLFSTMGFLHSKRRNRLQVS